MAEAGPFVGMRSGEVALALTACLMGLGTKTPENRSAEGISFAAVILAKIYGDLAAKVLTMHVVFYLSCRVWRRLDIILVLVLRRWVCACWDC